ncbi:MAG: PAAR domain-containing protein [Acidobacteria bacterium]|nr:PAAR domain-containing protein [Acidobacteriota bacterium]
MPPAARLSDMHTCPMVTGVVPHVGGPILPPCCPTVITGGLPQARVGDMLVCAGGPDVIAVGSPTVIVGGMMAARLGDLTVHGGVIVVGCPTVIIGEVGAGAGGPSSAAAAAIVTATAAASREALKDPPSDSPQSSALQEAANEGSPLVEKCPYADH